MAKMTHGEIRATLLLLAIMAIVVVYAFIFKTCNSTPPSADSPQLTPSGDIRTATSREQMASDSIILARRAAEANRRDSMQRADRAARRSNTHKEEIKKKRNRKTSKTSPTKSHVPPAASPRSTPTAPISHQ